MMGRNGVINSNYIAGSAGHLVSTGLIGQDLIVSASHTSVTSGGTVIVGRFNATGSLQESSQDTVFVVGTGTAANTRRNAIRIDNNNNTTITGSVTISGSLSVNNIPVLAGTTGLITTGSIATTQAITGSLIVSGSQNVTGSVNITGSLNLNGSPLNVLASGQFISLTTLTASAGVSGSIAYTTSGSTNNITLNGGGTQITVGTAGVYNIQFSAQWDCASGSDSGYVWFKKNGTNISNSASRVTMDNNTSQIMTVNFLDNASPNDYYEVVWQNAGGHARLLSELSSGNIPNIPSVITTINQIR
jgi:hypothetical protein